MTVYRRNARSRNRRLVEAVAVMLMGRLLLLLAAAEGERRANAAAADDGQWIRPIGDC